MKHDTDKKHNHLVPIKHKQRDLFIADLFDTACFKTDITSMEYPLFALKGGDNRVIRYEQNNFKVKISPEIELGRATIHDKDIWIYCISKIMHAMNEGKEYDRTVCFTIYDYLKMTNRGTSGRDYAEAKNSLERLASTRLTTEIETDKIKEAQGFGLIDSWRIIEEKDGRMIRVSVTLSDWLFRSIEAKAVLTINEDYFRLRKPLDRRIYELARKHCGNNKTWSFNLKTLLERSGSTASIKKFRQAIKSLANSNQLPDYAVTYDQEKDKVIFLNRNYKTKTQQEKINQEHNQNMKAWRENTQEKEKLKEQKKQEKELARTKYEAEISQLPENFSGELLSEKTGNIYQVKNWILDSSEAIENYGVKSCKKDRITFRVADVKSLIVDGILKFK